MTRDDDSEWLRDTVDDELLGLFSDDRSDLGSTVSRLLERLPFDEELEEKLIETLETGLDLANDDTQGSVWIALLLGEAAATRATSVLVRALSQDDDEELQQAAGIALLKCGTAGIDAIVAALDDDEPSPVLTRAGLEWLGRVASLQDEALREGVMAWLDERLEREVVRPESQPLVEGIALAASWLGQVDLLPRLRDAQRALGVHTELIEDALEMLESNTSGVPIADELLPGESEYAWAFEYQGESFRPRQGPRKREVIAHVEDADRVGRQIDEEEGLAIDERDRETLYRGLGGHEESD